MKKILMIFLTINFFFISYFYIYIKRVKKYYQKKKQKTKKSFEKKHVKDTKIFLKKEKKKSISIIVIEITIFLKKKNNR